MKDLVIKVARRVQDENKVKINFGCTMIELPRAAIKQRIYQIYRILALVPDLAKLLLG